MLWVEKFTGLTGQDDMDSLNETSVTLYYMGIDYDFVPGYDIKLLAGRNFSKDFKTDEKRSAS